MEQRHYVLDVVSKGCGGKQNFLRRKSRAQHAQAEYRATIKFVSKNPERFRRDGAKLRKSSA